MSTLRPPGTTWTGSASCSVHRRAVDVMIVAGTLTNKMAPALCKVYDQMPGRAVSVFFSAAHLLSLPSFIFCLWL